MLWLLLCRGGIRKSKKGPLSWVGACGHTINKMNSSAAPPYFFRMEQFKWMVAIDVETKPLESGSGNTLWSQWRESLYWIASTSCLWASLKIVCHLTPNSMFPEHIQWGRYLVTAVWKGCRLWGKAFIESLVRVDLGRVWRSFAIYLPTFNVPWTHSMKPGTLCLQSFWIGSLFL